MLFSASIQPWGFLYHKLSDSNVISYAISCWELFTMVECRWQWWPISDSCIWSNVFDVWELMLRDTWAPSTTSLCLCGHFGPSNVAAWAPHLHTMPPTPMWHGSFHELGAVILSFCGHVSWLNYAEPRHMAPVAGRHVGISITEETKFSWAWVWT